MKIRAMGNHVILDILEAPKEDRGIALPAETREAIMSRNVAVVMSVGPEVNRKAQGTAVISDDEELPEDEQVRIGQVVAYWSNRCELVPGRNHRNLRAVRRDAIIGVVIEDKQATPAEKKEMEEHIHGLQMAQEAHEAQREIVRARPVPKIVQ